MTAIPSEAVFAAHGLSSVTLDVPTPASSKTFLPRTYAAATSLNLFSGWVTGIALLSPTGKFPVFQTHTSYSQHPVNFAFCPLGDSSLLARFRRQAQFRALDSIDYTIGLPAPSKSGKGKEPVSLASEVIAWWEDERGLWLVTERDPPNTVPFIEYWSGIMNGAPHAAHGVSDGRAFNTARPPTAGSLLYANLCEALGQVVRRLIVLQNRRLSILSCQPNMFHNDASCVQIARYTEAIALPGFDWHKATIGTPLATSALFQRDPPDPAGHIADQLIRRNLRFVPPETAVTRFPSPSGAIYSFGVMAYELLTGAWTSSGAESPDEADVDLLTDIHRHLTVDPIPLDRVLRSEAMIGGLLTDYPPRQFTEIIMKCLARDMDARYATLDALLHDLERLNQICRSGGDLERFTVGAVDRMSRFNVPAQPVHREIQLAEMDATWAYVTRSPDADQSNEGKDLFASNVNLWGTSGSGKSRLAHSWIQRLDIERADSISIVGYAKMDEHIQNPLSSFIQIFQSLIDQVLTDPREDAKGWNRRIREVVGAQFPFFLALLSNDIKRLLQLGGERLPPHPDTINWENFINAFRHWPKNLLQLFATIRRPLILLVDDIQWLQKEEIQLWRGLLDDPHPLNHCLMLTLLRTDRSSPPDPMSLLSMTAQNIQVPKLREEGVEAYIATSLQGPVDNLSNLTSFLYAETSGSPLFLRTLMSSLVNDQVVYFDYEVLVWRFDPIGLQRHLSEAGVDAYLSQLVNSFPETSRRRMMLLSLLPANGFKIDDFAVLIDIPTNELRSLIDLAAARGTLIVREGERFRFSHDRARMAAYNTIPVNELGDFHRRVSLFLRRPELIDDYLFEAADHALSAREYGAPKEDESTLVELLLNASKRAALSAGFETAKRFLDASEDIINETGGYLVWTQTHRRIYIRFLSRFSEVCSVLRLHQRVYDKLDEIEPLCESPAERIKVSIWRVRQYVSENRTAQMLELTWECMSRHGFDIDQPLNVRRWIPQRPEDVDALAETIIDEPNLSLSQEEDPRVLIMTLLAFAGPTIFAADPGQRSAAFVLGVSLVAATRRVYEPSAYMTAVQAITTSDVPIKRALCELAKKMASLRPSSFLTGSALVVIAAQCHCWMPLERIDEEMDTAYDECYALGNYELAAYVFVLDCSARSFSLKSQRWSLLNERYGALRSFMEGSFRPIISALLQFHENIAQTELRQKPWALEGAFTAGPQLGSSQGLVMHYGYQQTFALRLAVYLDAPLEEQVLIVEQGLQYVVAMEGTVAGVEWSYLSAVVWLRGGSLKTPLSALRADLRRNARSPDWQIRLDLLEALETLNESGLNGIPLVETILSKLETDSRHYLSGLLNYYTGDVIMKATGSNKLAAGFFRASFKAYKEAEWFAAAEMVRSKHPGICNDPRSHTRLPSEILGIAPTTITAPALRRASLSTGDATLGSQASSSNHRDDKAEDVSVDGSLDTLTLMRSSLALASETDPNILLCTLLRILCQFVRADFAAIALSDEKDPDSLRLRAAGPSSRILPYDHAINDESLRDKAPAYYMMHVARTGKSITKSSSLSHVRQDPFYTSKPPRSIVCQQILNQGVHAGVIVLSSSTYANSPAVTAGAREVISCLATFATIVMTNASFTDRLKEVVDQRTKELSNALAAKTRFLSQCSHELRSPLSAVLGLAAVLEASPGLNGVQQEHLRTIISSGEDLLGLINNILDHSKLENGSVSLERIPFTLRDVIESGLDAIAAVAQKKNLEISLINAITTDPPAMIGDPFRVKQILLNLLSNAVKFTSKGQVTVVWHYEELSGDMVLVSIDVQDTGIGIPASKMDKLFQSFSQIDESITRSFGGSGLGLIISKDLAKLLGGDCVASSEFGKGSRFTFSFTARRNPEQPVREWEKFEREKSCFVLCHEGPWYDMINRNLEALGCQPVLFKQDAHECLELGYPDGLNSAKQFDYVIVNPEMIAKKTLDEMRKLQPKSKFIFLVRSIDLAKYMMEYELTRESIVARPVRFASLYASIAPSPSSITDLLRPSTTLLQQGKKKGVNQQLSRACPMDILLVDDNAVNVTVGRRILELFGYKNVASANDGQQGVDEAERKQYDLILLDLQMPVLDGFSAQKRIEASPLAGDPCVVALTANADHNTQLLCTEAGFFDYLSKPLDIPKLERILKEVYKYRNGKRIANYLSPHLQ